MLAMANSAVSWSIPTVTQPWFRARSYTPYGVARPSSLSTKSCTRTGSGWPLGRSSRPPFLNGPTSSFFLASTEMAGCPAATCRCTWSFRYANCASRSGCWLPSRTFRLACKLYASSCSNSATNWWLTEWPIPRSSSASFRTLLHVHRRGDSGPPRVTGSTRRSRSSRSVGSVSVVRFRPPPGRRIRTVPAGGPSVSSLIPAPITRRDTPVARATVLAPPHPIAIASLAAHSRRARSSRCRASNSNRRLIASTSAMPHSLAQSPALCYVYSLTSPKLRAEMRVELRELQRRVDVTSIYVTRLVRRGDGDRGADSIPRRHDRHLAPADR